MKKFIILFIILSLSITGFTQKDGENIVIGKYKKIYSKILKEDRLLLVKLPKNYDNDIEKYPVLYLLYGDYMEQYFADAVSTIHKLSESGKIPKMILIGVGNTERYRDLLPIDRRGSTGNAEKFHSFFSKELIPFINKSYRANNYRILVGPQAGGSFGLNTIIKKHDMFSAFLINSPFFSNTSNDYLIKIAPDILKRSEILKKFFYITYKLTNVPRFKIEFMKKFRNILNDEILNGSKWVFNELKNNDSFIPPLGIKNGLRLLFDEYRFPMNRPVKEINDLKLYYKKVSDKYGFIIKIPARVILIKGDHFNSKKDTKKALEFYNFLLKQYPKDLNGYFRLADISEREGDYKEALKNFKILEQLSPGEVFFKKSIIRLKKKIKGK